MDDEETPNYLGAEMLNLARERNASQYATLRASAAVAGVAAFNEGLTREEWIAYAAFVWDDHARRR